MKNENKTSVIVCLAAGIWFIAYTMNSVINFEFMQSFAALTSNGIQYFNLYHIALILTGLAFLLGAGALISEDSKEFVFAAIFILAVFGSILLLFFTLVG